jgi:pSer/pThr/pTyr-binding forkhead associated (FHA) protein
VPVYQHEVSIGRGSQSKPVDIPLKGDPEISRKHIALSRDASGNYWLSHEGRNATFVSGREMQPGQRLPVSPGENITICTYMLRIIPN